MTYTFIRNSQFSFLLLLLLLSTLLPLWIHKLVVRYIHIYIHVFHKEGRDPIVRHLRKLKTKQRGLNNSIVAKFDSPCDWSLEILQPSWHVVVRGKRKRAAWGGGLCGGRARRTGPGSRLPGSVRQSSVGWATHSPLPNKSLQWIKRIGVVMATSTISLSFWNLHQTARKDAKYSLTSSVRAITYWSHYSQNPIYLKVHLCPLMPTDMQAANRYTCLPKQSCWWKIKSRGFDQHKIPHKQLENLSPLLLRKGFFFPPQLREKKFGDSGMHWSFNLQAFAYLQLRP